MPRTKELIKMLEGLIERNQHLYSAEKMAEMKKELYSLKQQLVQLQKENSKGFSK